MPKLLNLVQPKSDYVALNGAVGSYISTPHTADLNPTNELDLRVWVKPSTWRPANSAGLIAKRVISTGFTYFLYLGASGALVLALSSDGSTAPTFLSTEVIPDDGAERWVRATWRASDKRVQFFTSLDGETWTQLGATGTHSVGSLFASTSIVEVGSIGAGSTLPLTGQVKAAELRTTIDGPIVARFDAKEVSGSGARPYVGSDGRVWTLHGGATLDNLHAMTVGSSAGPNTNQPKHLPYDGEKYVWFPGVNGNTIVADPTPAPASPDLDIRYVLRRSAWTLQAAVAALCGPATGAGGFSPRIQSTGVPSLYIHDGTTAEQTVASTSLQAAGAPTNQWIELRYTYRNSDKRLQIHWRPESGGVWTQVGIDTNGTLSIPFRTALWIGARTSAAEAFDGDIKSVIMRDGIDGPALISWSAADMGQTGGSSGGLAWTINRSTGANYKTAVVDRPMFVLDGVDDYLEALHHDDLDFGVGQPYTIVAAWRHHHTPSNFGRLLSKELSTQGWSVVSHNSNGQVYHYHLDSIGTNQSPALGNPASLSSVNVGGWGRSQGDPSVVFGYVNGVRQNAVSARSVDARSSQVLRVGAIGGATPSSLFVPAEFLGAAIFRRALTDAEIALVAAELGAAA
jgi:hypothetical protein